MEMFDLAVKKGVRTWSPLCCARKGAEEGSI